MTDALTTYDIQRGRDAFYFDSYWGGERYRTPSSPTLGRAVLSTWAQKVGPDGMPLDEYQQVDGALYQSYLVPHPGETARAFNARISLAGYINLCQPIVDAYVDAVCGPVRRDLGAIDRYVSSLDGRSRGWAEYVEEVARWAAVYGYCASVYDVPKDNPSTSLADEEARGVGLRATLVHPTAFAWMVVGDDGELSEFAFADAAYFQPENGYQRIRFWVYTRTTWALYETTVQLAFGLASARTTLVGTTPVREGLLPTSMVGRIPVVFAYFRQDTSSSTPRGVPLIGDAADLCRQIYNTLSCVEEIHRMTAFPFLAIPEPSQGGQLDPSTRKMIGPQNALGYNSATGAPAWVQPSAESTRELRDHVAFLAAQALSTTGLDVGSDSAPTASGEALKVRSRDFDARCGRFARNLAAFEQESMAVCSRLLGIAPPAPPTYPKRFVLPDPASDLSRALLLLTSIGGELGPEGTRAAIRAALDAGLSLSDDQLTAIMDGIKAQTAVTPEVQP